MPPEVPASKTFSYLQFHKLFPAEVQKWSDRHWTPMKIAREAANFLVTGKGVKVLDIGSGVGNFCLTAACHKPEGRFFGVEQRKVLTAYANNAKRELGLSNVSFIHDNFTRLNLADYDHFYFFNSFYENLDGTEKIDQSVEHSTALYNYYNRYLFRRLDQMPIGTRIATFHSTEDEIPPSYYIVKTYFEGSLKFWIKV